MVNSEKIEATEEEVNDSVEDAEDLYEVKTVEEDANKIDMITDSFDEESLKEELENVAAGFTAEEDLGEEAEEVDLVEEAYEEDFPESYYEEDYEDEDFN